jgi:hypothetical protein
MGLIKPHCSPILLKQKFWMQRKVNGWLDKTQTDSSNRGGADGLFLFLADSIFYRAERSCCGHLPGVELDSGTEAMEAVSSNHRQLSLTSISSARAEARW